MITQLNPIGLFLCFITCEFHLVFLGSDNINTVGVDKPLGVMLHVARFNENQNQSINQFHDYVINN